MRKYINSVLAIVLALTVAATPAVFMKPQKSKAFNSAQTVQTTETVTTETSATTKSETVTVNQNAYKNFTSENDKFYEPEKDSITVVEDNIAYINDAVAVYFTDDATQEQKDNLVKSVNGEVVGKVDDMNEYEIKVTRSDIYELDSLCDELMKDEAVEFATCSVANQYDEQSIPDDPWGGFAYWDDNALDSYFTFRNWWIKAADIDKAWDYKEYFNHINIGVVDSGFDVNHEDLQGKIVFPDRLFERSNIPDDHGTHVSGIIAANHNNKIGVTGVVDDCTLICADWEADKEYGQFWFSDLRILTGLNHVVKAGAKVVNFSIGSSGTIINGTTDKFRFVKDIESKVSSFYIAKLLQKGYDFICCQSAGNGTKMKKTGEKFAVDASNNGIFSAITTKNAVKTVIGVSPQDIVDRIIIVASAKFNGNNEYEQSSFSNGGSQVSICAPGSDVYSTYYDRDTGKSTYSYLSGTSMSCPVVTGIASLVWSVNPEFTGAQVKHFVCDEENTKYVVKDSSNANHLPQGTMRMVNAELAVKAAIKATYGEIKADTTEETIIETTAFEVTEEKVVEKEKSDRLFRRIFSNIIWR
ncbi:MAG: S8 family serine peptidase [Ruminococcus sp.]|nr:S8 family serine peptidase [Candidatus Copronaster equi]